MCHKELLSVVVCFSVQPFTSAAAVAAATFLHVEHKLQTGEAGAILSTCSVYLTMLSKKALS